MSAGFDAIFNPVNTITDVKTSAVDSIASATKAFELPRTPAVAFIIASKILVIIPIKVDLIPFWADVLEL